MKIEQKRGLPTISLIVGDINFRQITLIVGELVGELH